MADPIGGRNMKQRPPLFAFAYHPWSSWGEIAEVAKPEPWGAENKILELYIRANFEIAKSQGKVFEDSDSNVAFWRAGSLVNETSDPVWLTYRKNRRETPYWEFQRATTGGVPDGSDPVQWTLRYEPPEFNRDWPIHFEQRAIKHILQDPGNHARLERVFSDAWAAS
jgi:hypothetical protein